MIASASRRPRSKALGRLRGIYQIEGEMLKLAFLPKLDARNPPPGLDRDRRPRSFDPQLVQIWTFRKALVAEPPKTDKPDPEDGAKPTVVRQGANLQRMAMNPDFDVVATVGVAHDGSIYNSTVTGTRGPGN